MPFRAPSQLFLINRLFVYHSVAELSEFASVPTACGTYEVASDALELVDVFTTAVRTFAQSLLGILKSAVHTAVAVVVYGTVADVVLVHQVHY